MAPTPKSNYSPVSNVYAFMNGALTMLIALLLATPGATRPAATAAVLPAGGVAPLDGKPGAVFWESVPAITEFVQREPSEGAVPSFRTEARVAYDRSVFHVRVRAFDPEPRRLVGILTRRDSGSPSDWVRVLVDSYHDRRTAYEFTVNPAGVKQDAYWFNDGNRDDSWDAVWDVAVSTDAEGWTAEFRIPFSQLRFNPDGTGIFGLALVREVGRLNETSTWPLLARSANGYVSSFGELRGMELDRAPQRLEVVPYLVSSLVTRPAQPGNPFARAVRPESSVGLDLKYALTPGLTLTATVNPDFGQVEADPAVVNLSAFETFFAERRPFFVEGSGVFRFDLDCNDGQCTGLFYSRRIGRNPQGSAPVPSGGFSDAPLQTTILGAAKVTGRVGAFSIGALNAVTSREDARIADGSARYRQAVEPWTSYSVARLRRELADQSSLGFMLTATQRRLTDNLELLPGQAYTGGVDWDWRLKGSRYSLGGNWAGSSVHGSSAAIDRLQRNSVHGFQRPDADHLVYDRTRDSLRGHTGSISLGKIAGEHLRFNVHAGYKSPGFEINDLGFQQRADTISQSNWVQWRREKPTRLLRSFRLNFNQWNGWNFGGDRRYRGGNVNAHATFQSNWSTGAGLNLEGAGLDDRSTRGGRVLRTNPRIGFWHFIESDNRKPIIVNGNYFLGSDRHGSRDYDFNPSLTFRPSEAVSITQGLGFSRNINDYQWVANVSTANGARPVFGHLVQKTVSLTTRVNYTITPNLSIQIYAQPFVSAGAYTRFRELADGRAAEYADRFRPFTFAGNPDFNFRSFRTTNVLRWEFKPGSSLFVVWQQSREGVLDRGDFRFGRDFGDVFGLPSHNVLLVKLLYWLNM